MLILKMLLYFDLTLCKKILPKMLIHSYIEYFSTKESLYIYIYYVQVDS